MKFSEFVLLLSLTKWNVAAEVGVRDWFVFDSRWLWLFIFFDDAFHSCFSIHDHSMLHTTWIHLTRILMIKVLVFPLSSFLLPTILVLRRILLFILGTIKSFIERRVRWTWPIVWGVSPNWSYDWLIVALNGALTSAVIFINLFKMTCRLIRVGFLLLLWSFERKSPVLQHLLANVLFEVFETFREPHWLGLYDWVFSVTHLCIVIKDRIEASGQALDCLKVTLHLLTIHLSLVDLVSQIAACFSSFLYATRAHSFNSVVFTTLSKVCFLCVLLLVVKLGFYNNVLCRWLDVPLGWKVKWAYTLFVHSCSMIAKERTITISPTATLCNGPQTACLSLIWAMPCLRPFIVHEVWDSNLCVTINLKVSRTSSSCETRIARDINMPSWDIIIEIWVSRLWPNTSRTLISYEVWIAIIVVSRPLEVSKVLASQATLIRVQSDVILWIQTRTVLAFVRSLSFREEAYGCLRSDYTSWVRDRILWLIQL